MHLVQAARGERRDRARPGCACLRAALRSRRKIVAGLVLGLEAGQHARRWRVSRSAYVDVERRGTTSAARKSASSAECGAGPEVDVVGAERDAGELAVGVGVLGGEPAAGQHADRAGRGRRPRAATANASGHDAGRVLAGLVVADQRVVSRSSCRA